MTSPRKDQLNLVLSMALLGRQETLWSSFWVGEYGVLRDLRPLSSERTSSTRQCVA